MAFQIKEEDMSFDCNIVKEEYEINYEKFEVAEIAEVAEEKPKMTYKFQCEICLKSFPRLQRLKDHMVNWHTGERNSNKCSKTFACKTKQSTIHGDPDGLSSHVCPICTKKFTNRRNLTCHMVRHNRKRSFQCELCGQWFFEKIQLKCHVMRVHEKRKQLYGLRKSFQNFMCSRCGKPFDSLLSRDEHTTSHTDETSYKCFACLLIFNSEEYLRNHARSHIKSFICKRCTKSFCTRESLRVHMLTHAVKSLPCNMCEKTFTNNRNLQAHIRRHYQERNFECELCGRKYFEKIVLQRHTKRVHEKKKIQFRKKESQERDHIFVCNHCGKSFANRQTYEDHLKTHKDVLVCAHCSMTFIRKENLEKHMVKSHVKDETISQQNGEKSEVSTPEQPPFGCLLCQKKFWFQHYLDKHMDTHKCRQTIYTCKICKKIFKSKIHFVKHQLDHNVEEEKFKCSKCKKIFLSIKFLTQHWMKYHNSSVELNLKNSLGI